MVRIIGKFFKWLSITILSVILIIVIYNIFDNNRIKVVEQEVEVVDLPEEFEGFKILQIADLHGKTFGKNQKRLLKKMNAIDYDMIAICGDMMDKQDIVEILSIDLIGMVPDDESIIISTNKGEPAILDERSLAGKAYRNIADRILGHDVPIMELQTQDGFFSKLKKMFGAAK